MKKFASVILSLVMVVMLSSAALASEKEMSQKKTVGNYEIELVTPDPLSEGEKDVTVKIMKTGAADAMGSNSESMPVKIMAEMDKSDKSMSMGMDNSKAQEQEMTQDQSGNHMAKINFQGNGKWIVTVMFGDMQKATFEVMVEKSGPNWVFVGGFVGIIILIILVAAFGRRKATSEGGACHECH